MDDLFLDRAPVLHQKAHHNSVEDEIVVLKKLDASEGCNAGQKQVTGRLEVANQHAVDAFKNLQLITFVPVSAIVDELFAGGDVLLEGVEVVLFQVHQKDLEEDFHLL